MIFYNGALCKNQEGKVVNLPMNCIHGLKFHFDTKKNFNSEIVIFYYKLLRPKYVQNYFYSCA